MNSNNKFVILTLLYLIFPMCALSERPVVVDSRIKVFIYNEYEVFRLALHYGRHAHIDFGKGEFVRSVSLGNNSNWYIEPMGSRLFLQPYEKDIYTNMTVITNKRTYEFDLVAKDPEDFDGEMDQDLVYVVKFFYPPSDGYNNLPQNIQKATQETNNAGDRVSQAVAKAPYGKVDNKAAQTINKKYSFIGDKSIAPIEIFDDSIMTYIKFKKKKNAPELYELDEHDSAHLLQTSNYKDYVLINGVFHKLLLKHGKKSVEIFNDN